jgi:hypothetical protein
LFASLHFPLYDSIRHDNGNGKKRKEIKSLGGAVSVYLIVRLFALIFTLVLMVFGGEMGWLSVWVGWLD